MTEKGENKKERSRDTLTQGRVDQVLGLIERWQVSWVRLTGENLAEKAGTCLGFKTTRPALLNSKKHPQIRKAYDDRVDELYGKKGPPKPKAPTEMVRAGRVQELEDENAKLRAANTAMRQKFVVWLGNARAKGMTEADLNAPLPSPRPEADKK
jgi:hypothetical protein